MAMVGEEDDLGFLGKSAQFLHHPLGSCVVEVEEDVVGDEGERPIRVAELRASTLSLSSTPVWRERRTATRTGWSLSSTSAWSWENEPSVSDENISLALTRIGP